MEWKNNPITEIQQIIANNKTYTVVLLLNYETRSTLYSVTCTILTQIQIIHKKCSICFRNWNTRIKARTAHITAKIAHVTPVSDSKMAKTAHLLIHQDFLKHYTNVILPKVLYYRKCITKIPNSNILEFDNFSRHPKVKFSKFVTCSALISLANRYFNDNLFANLNILWNYSNLFCINCYILFSTLSYPM